MKVTEEILIEAATVVDVITRKKRNTTNELMVEDFKRFILSWRIN